MLALELFVDDQRVCLAGMEDWSVLSAILSAVRPDARRPDDEGQLDISVGGLTEHDADGIAYHARWARIDLKIGSTVTIKVVDAEAPDPAIKRYRSDRAVQEPAFTDEEIEQMEREDWQRLKAKFEPEGGNRK